MTDVLPEYTDEHLTAEAARDDVGEDYRQSCRSLLRIPASERQGIAGAAYRATHRTVYTNHGAWGHQTIRSDAMDETTGDYFAEIERLVVARLLAEATE